MATSVSTDCGCGDVCRGECDGHPRTGPQMSVTHTLHSRTNTLHPRTCPRMECVCRPSWEWSSHGVCFFAAILDLYFRLCLVVIEGRPSCIKFAEQINIRHRKATKSQNHPFNETQVGAGCHRRIDNHTDSRLCSNFTEIGYDSRAGYD